MAERRIAVLVHIIAVLCEENNGPGMFENCSVELICDQKMKILELAPLTS